MAKRNTLEQIGIALGALLISWIVWLLITHMIDCARGSYRYSEVMVVDKQFREAWTETTVTTETYTANGHQYTRPVVHQYYHAAQYLLHISDTAGYRTAFVGEGLYHHYRIGDRARLRLRIGQSGCKCSETVL